MNSKPWRSTFCSTVKRMQGGIHTNGEGEHIAGAREDSSISEWGVCVGGDPVYNDWMDEHVQVGCSDWCWKCFQCGFGGMGIDG